MSVFVKPKRPAALKVLVAVGVHCAKLVEFSTV